MGEIYSNWINGRIDENSLSELLALEERNELIKFSSPSQLAMQLISFPIFLKNSIPLQKLWPNAKFSKDNARRLFFFTSFESPLTDNFAHPVTVFLLFKLCFLA